jgi:ketosteroid isomerase-like protein
MSQENVGIAHRLFEAFNRTYAEGTDLYELLDPEVEWIPMSAGLEVTSHHGHGEVRQWVEEMKRDWSSFETKPERYLDLGDNRVLALGSGVRVGAEAMSCLISRRPPGCFRSERESSSAWRPSPSEKRPSKPPSCGSSDGRIERQSRIPARGR